MNKRKIKLKNWKSLVMAILVIFFMSGYSCLAANNSADTTGNRQVIEVIIGESTVVKTPWPAIRVAVTEPKIANVQVLMPDQVLVQGMKLGSTDLIMWSEGEKNVQQWKVKVNLDLVACKSKLDELFPTASLKVSQGGDSVIVKGSLRSTEDVSQLHSYLEKCGIGFVDMTSVAGVQQVKLEVRVAEVSRMALRALGMNMLSADDSFFGGIRTGSDSGGALVPSINIGPPESSVVGSSVFTFNQDVSASPSITVFGGFPKSNLEFFFKALAENQYLRLLANPTLVSLSGEEASFLAGGEYPIPVVQGTGGGTVGTSITIEYREYGIRLSFRPVVLGDGSIRLFTAPEVSELTDTGAVVIEGFSIPALLTRKAHATLELKNGQTFAMAGLLQNSTSATNSRIPGLGDLPVLGPLFRSVRYQEKETDLVVLVTVSLVEPMSLAQAPPVPGLMHVYPNDWEFYIEGRLEGKTQANLSPADCKWLKQMGLDGLAGPGAWESYGQPASPSQAEAR